MADLKVYWQEVRALQRSLPEFVWLMSVEDARRGLRGGQMAQVGAERAAQLLIAKSHRLATEEETAAHLAKEEQVRRQSVHDGLRRKGIAVVAVPVSAAPPAEDSKRGRARQR